MKSNGSDSRCHRWASILAGGDGKRLLPLTRKIAGDDRPRQFCPVLGDETLLQETQRRVSKLVPSWRTLLVLTRKHEPFYADEVAGIPSSRLLIQPSNQGTAPPILYSLLRLREMDPKSVVAFFPSDHHFSDDESRLRPWWLITEANRHKGDGMATTNGSGTDFLVRVRPLRPAETSSPYTSEADANQG
jgi:mannose-1-phosphate guanylyltransferase